MTKLKQKVRRVLVPSFLRANSQVFCNCIDLQRMLVNSSAEPHKIYQMTEEAHSVKCIENASMLADSLDTEVNAHFESTIFSTVKTVTISFKSMVSRSIPNAQIPAVTFHSTRLGEYSTIS